MNVPMLLAVFLVPFGRIQNIATASNSNDWPRATLEQVGIDSEPLIEMFDFVRAREIPVHSVQIVRHGKLALDAYFYPYGADMRHDVASVTKSITSTLVGIAIEKGYLRGVDERVVELFPPMHSEAPIDPHKTAITLRDLLTMQAGWDCGFDPNEARLFEMRRSPDWPQFMLALPMVAEPGTHWAYCSGNCHVLSAIITRTTGTNALAFARREFFEPLGIHDVMWETDSQGNNHGWGDLQLHPRDMAKIGQLFLQRGQWRGRQIVPESWIREATREHVDRTINNDHYGYFWWVKGTNFPGMFEAVGRGGQRINVWPKEDLVIVFTGGDFEPGDISSFILRALKSETRLPTNPSGSSRLREKIRLATQAPSPSKVPPLPEIAARISGKPFQLSTNGLDMTELALRFTRSEAGVELTRNGLVMKCGIGLDGVERFSRDMFVGLPFAAKGRWIDAETFLLQLNRVGGINRYDFTLKFSPDANSVNGSLKEHTGLNNEVFSGLAKR
jgi:CubicO group peptidase (beta-lactamase class C family)